MKRVQTPLGVEQPDLNGLRDSGSAQFQKPRSSKLFGVLFTLSLLKAVMPGLVNFTEQAHPLPGAERFYHFTPTAEAVSWLLSVVLAAACIGVLLKTRKLKIGYRTVLLLVLAALTLERGSAQGLFSVGGISNVIEFALLAFALSSLVLRPSDFRIVAIGGFVVALGSILFGLVAAGQARFIIGGSGVDESKAFFGGDFVLAGPFTHSNTLGVFVALSLPFVRLFNGIVIRAILWSGCIAAVILSASRTAVLALIAWILFWMFGRLLRNLEGSISRGLLLVFALGLIAALPLVSGDDPDGFSGRSAVWRDSLAAYWDSGLLVGVGPYWDMPASALSSASRTSGHNLYVQWLVTGGLLLIIVGITVVVLFARRANQADAGPRRPVFTSYAFILLVISSTEFLLPMSMSSQLLPVTFFIIIAVIFMVTHPRQASWDAAGV
ncbi:O-antigen ligase family protein [Terrabacter sp. 2TAF16]